MSGRPRGQGAARGNNENGTTGERSLAAPSPQADPTAALARLLPRIASLAFAAGALSAGFAVALALGWRP
jgi:hypothetical protein